MVRAIVTLLSLTGLAMGQAMVQHAAAAAGGAAAAAGSKKVADGLEKILGSAAGAVATAAGPEKPKQIAITPPQIPAAGKRAKHSPFEPQVNRAGGNELVGPYAGRIAMPSPSEVESRSAGDAMPSNAWTPRRTLHQSQGAASITPFVANDAPVVGRAARRTAEAMMGFPTVNEAAFAVIPMALIATRVLPPE